MPFKIVLRRSSIAVWDAVMWVGATILMTLLRYDLSLSGHRIESIFYYTIFAITLQIIFGVIFQVYLGRNKIGSFSEVAQLSLLVIVVALVVGAGSLVFDPDVPRGVTAVVSVPPPPSPE